MLVSRYLRFAFRVRFFFFPFCYVTWVTLCDIAFSQPRSQSSSAISDVTSPVKLVGKVRRECCNVSSRYRTRFQASSGNSDNANWPGYEDGIFMSDSVSCRFQGIRNFLKISGRCGTMTWWPNDMQCLKNVLVR